MKDFYTINEVAIMSGFTTRSLRMFIQQGFLEGEKMEGKWCFTAEQVDSFLTNPNISAGIKIKNNAVVYDFLADFKKPENQACVVLDLHISSEAEYSEISSYFCNAMSAPDVSNCKMKLEKHESNARLILSGPEDCIYDIMKHWYEK